MGNPSLRELAYNSIWAWMSSGLLPKGSVTSEVELSRRLDMSRTPVRAALQQLETEGYIRIVPKHGVLVLDASAQRVGDLLDVAASLVLYAVENCRRMDGGTIRNLAGEFVPEIRALFGRSAGHDADRDALSRMEYELLKRLVSCSGNREMERLYELTVAKLYWTQNMRRWKQPYLQETAIRVDGLLSALSEDIHDFRPSLFAYFSLLKKTWT